MPKPQDSQARPGGRPRDPAREHALLEAANELLPEVGYDRLTIEAVAARAGAGRATVYRRWKDKSELVRDAIATLGWHQPPPDTGSLRSDLIALGAMYLDSSSRRDATLSALATAVSRDPQLREIVDRVIAEPRRAAYAVIVDRARERGEISNTADTELITDVVPAMIFYRLLNQEEPIDGEFFERIIDSLMIPLLAGPVSAS